MSKSVVFVLGALIGLLIAASIAAAPAFGNDEAEPETFEVAGKTCVYHKGELECFCPCEMDSCSSEPQIVTVPYTNTIISTTVYTQVIPVREVVTVTIPMPMPVTSTLPITVPDPEVAPMPDSESEQEDTVPSDDTAPKPKPQNDKPPCNQGVGNDAEGCDPGNSNYNQPSNDENGGQPGDPGRGHNDNGSGQGNDKGK